METPQTYRLQAELCARQAEHAKTPQHRASLLEMVQTWLRLADWATDKDAFSVHRCSTVPFSVPILAPAAHSTRSVLEPLQRQH